MKKLVGCLFLILVFALCIWGGGQILPVLACDYLLSKSVYKSIYCPSNEGKPSKLMTSTVSGTPKQTVSILFIGNSFTYTNDLPAMLVQVASSDSTNTTQLEIQSVTRTGAHLANMWQEGISLKLLQSKHWDYVVLQENSCWICTRDQVDETFSAINLWVWAVRNVSAKPVFFETWSDKAGSIQYSDRYVLGGQDPDKVQQSIHTNSANLAKSYHMDLVPVGDYWAYVRKQPKAPELYDGDNHHPRPAGTFLAAILFYRCFTGNMPTHVTYRPPDLTPEQAQLLIADVSQ
jgi:hypothetical protein